MRTLKNDQEKLVKKIEKGNIDPTKILKFFENVDNKENNSSGLSKPNDREKVELNEYRKKVKRAIIDNLINEVKKDELIKQCIEKGKLKGKEINDSLEDLKNSTDAKSISSNVSKLDGYVSYIKSTIAEGIAESRISNGPKIKNLTLANWNEALGKELLTKRTKAGSEEAEKLGLLVNEINSKANEAKQNEAELEAKQNTYNDALKKLKEVKEQCAAIENEAKDAIKELANVAKNLPLVIEDVDFGPRTKVVKDLKELQSLNISTVMGLMKEIK